MEILEWDFLMDANSNVFVVGCSRFPDLNCCGQVTNNLIKQVSKLMNDSDFFKFINGTCLNYTLEDDTNNLVLLVNQWEDSTKKHIEEGK